MFDHSPEKFPHDATKGASIDATFLGSIMSTSALRLGSVCSLGVAWSDGPGIAFPRHDKAWAQKCQPLETRDQVLHISDAFGPQSLDWGDRIRVYSYTLAFLASHGEIDNEAPSSGLAKWIWGNRKFFTGDRYLEDHARALNTRVFSHALFFCGHLMWYKAMILSGNRYFDPMLGLTETDI
jgi:hypothetical protein